MCDLHQLTVTDIADVTTVHSEKGRYLKMENRAWYGLSFCREGEIIYTQNGKQTRSDPTCAVILPQGGCYELEGSKTGDFPLINFYCTPDCDIREFVRIPLHSPESYWRHFEALREAMLLGDKHRLRALGKLYDILHRLARESEMQNDALAPIVAYLEEHYADPTLSNAMLAAQGRISEVYMRQLFRERLGTSPKQYVQELRMQKAKQLLSEGDAPVGEIAAACGFAAIYHFCRTFKEAVGQSPTDYRRENRKTVL